MSSTPETTRLPVTVTPDRYGITIAPDLDAATFAGQLAVDLTVHDATDRIVCNAAELEIHDAWVERLDGTRLPATPRLDDDAEVVCFSLGETIPPGEAVLHVRYEGVLNDRLRGFYRSTFTDAGGETRTIAVTQFEATDARRAFPCWDEPAHKAVFGVTLEVADGLLAVSNGPELRRERLEGDRVRITFADTMPMSTYLVAFVVGPLEATDPVDVQGVPLRVVHTPGQAHLAGFALEVGAFALEYFSDYYGIVYPGQKLDMVAVPDFAFGAMENLGCVTYRETMLLVDPATATQSELSTVVDVIAHELAHMWFGDLVTMSWWNGIWLNEAFATFMEIKCAEAFRPAWARWMHFGRERSAAFDTDALTVTRAIEYPVHTPEDAEAMFDVLTYQKGSAVVRMLEQYLGEDAFRDGIRRYLQTHQFANTETSDLWDALEAETGEPVRSMMDSWIFQRGFPLVDVRAPEPGRLDLRQRVFRYDGTADDTRWEIPIVLDAGGGAERVLLDGEDLTATRATDGRVVANAGGHGFYRVRYHDGLFGQLVAELPALEPLERYALVDDSLALALRGDLSAAEVAALVPVLVASGEVDLAIWELAAEAIVTFDHIVADDDRADWSAWRIRTLRPLWERLGADVAPADDDRRRALRGVVLAQLGIAGDPEIVELAHDRFDRSADPGSVDPGVASGSLQVVATLADADTFGRILDRFRHGATPQEQMRHLYAAARVERPDVFDQYLALLDRDEVRSQNLAFAGRAALRNHRNGARAWAHVRDRWERLMDRLPSNSVHRLLEGITALDDPGTADGVARFCADHPLPQAEQKVAQHVERMRVSVAFRARESGRFVRELTA